MLRFSCPQVIGSTLIVDSLIKDRSGRILSDFLGPSRIEVGCKVLPVRYDPFRVHVCASYRQLFERALMQLLERKGMAHRPY